MVIADGKVVTLSFEMKDDEGEILDSSDESGDLDYLHGTKFLMPGMEKALLGKKVGDMIDETFEPDEAFGEYDENLVIEAKKADFHDNVELFEGLEFQADIGGESRYCEIVEINGDKITVDANHPLADMTIHVKATVKSIRDATVEELEHGHAHGPDGHHDHD